MPGGPTLCELFLIFYYTPCRDTAISLRGVISLSSFPLLRLRQCYNIILPYRTTFYDSYKKTSSAQ